jgi:hypothetical protein
MAMTPAQFIALEGNIRKSWAGYFHDEKDYLGDLYNLITDEDSQLTDFTYGAAGRMTPWAGTVAYDTIKPGYEKTYRPDQVSTGVQVPRNMWEDRSFRLIKTLVNTIAQGVADELAYESADIFNDAFSTVRVGADSAALCSASHHLVPGDTAQSNTGTNNLDYTGIETTKLAMRNLNNDRGSRMRIPMDMIIAGSYWEDTCIKLFGSDKEAFVSDNQINAYKGMKYYIHPLIDGKIWFGVNSKMMKGGAGLNFWMRRDPRILERDASASNAANGDFNTEMISWKAVGRWDKGWTNWFWCYGNNPS